MPNKTTKPESKSDCDCEALNSEIERYTRQLAELDQELQSRDARIAELEEALAKCGDAARIQRERDHAVNRVQQLEAINTDLDGKVKVLTAENAEQSGCIKAFKAVCDQVSRLAPLRSSNAPASAGRTDVNHKKKIPKFSGDGINPQHPAHPAHPEHESWKAEQEAIKAKK